MKNQITIIYSRKRGSSNRYSIELPNLEKYYEDSRLAITKIERITGKNVYAILEYK